MAENWIVGEEYMWEHPNGSTDRVILKAAPAWFPEKKGLNLVKTSQEGPSTSPLPSLECEVEVLDSHNLAFVKISELKRANQDTALHVRTSVT